MNILYISYDGLADLVSSSQVIPYLLGLSAKGAKIFLISYEKAEKIRDTSAQNYFSDKMKAGGVVWKRLVYHKRPSVLSTVWDILCGVVAGLNAVKKEGIDIIHARGYVPSMIGAVIKKISNKRLIFDMRGFWPEEKVDSGALRERGLLFRALKKMEEFIAGNSDEVVVLTSAARKRLLKNHAFPSNVSVIPCGVDTYLFAEKKDDRTGRGTDNYPSILYVGSLGSFYDVKAIFAFLKRVKEEFKDATLNIYSDCGRSYVDKEARAAGIMTDEYALRKVAHRDMPSVFASSDISLIFYKRRLSGDGCCPIKLGESLASGVPVVVGPGTGDCKDLIEGSGAGVVLDEYSDAEYTRALDFIKELRGRKNLCGKACRDLAKKRLDIASGVESYLAVYRRLQ